MTHLKSFYPAIENTISIQVTSGRIQTSHKKHCICYSEEFI